MKTILSTQTRRRLGITLCILTAGAFSDLTTRAADGTWTNPSGGNWSEAGNWSGGAVADGAGSTARFNTLDLNASVSVVLDSARTNGNLIFADTDSGSLGGWALSGGPLTLAGGTPTITVSNLGAGSATISAVLTGQGFVKKGDSTLTLSAANTMVGANQLDAGLLVYANATALGGNSNTLAFNGGAIQFQAGAPALNLTNLSVLTTATVIATNGNYDNFMASGGRISGDANSVLYVTILNRFTPGGTGNSSWDLFKGFLGTIDLNTSSSAGVARMNLGATNIYDLSTVTLNSGTVGGRFQWRTTTAGSIVRIGALTGTGGGLQASEQAGNPLLTWEIGYKNLSTVYGGVISDVAANRRGALVKVGTGTLTLTSTNTYTGSTIISNGVLALANAAVLLNTPAITVLSPGTFDVSGLTNDFGFPNQDWSLRASQVLAGNGTVLGAVVLTNGLVSPGSNAVGTLTSNQLTLTNGASARFDVVSPAASDKIVVNGDLNLTGTGAVQLVPSAANVIITNGTYVLFEWTGNLIGDLANISFSYPFQLGTLTVSTNASKQIVLTVSGSTLIELGWRGDVSGQWTGAANWRDTSNVATTWADGRVANFNDTGINKSVNLSADVSPARVVVDGTSDYQFSSTGGKITGSGVLVKSGTGKLVIGMDNDYLGTTTINSNATIQVGTGGTAGSIGGDLVNDGRFIINRSDALTYTKPISGTGSLLHYGAGQLTLTGDYTYTGATVVTNGATLQLGDGTINGSVQGTIVLSNNATLHYLNNANSVNVGNSLSGSGAVVYEFSSGARTYLYTTTVTNTGFTGSMLIKGFSRVEVPSVAAEPSGPITVEDLGAFYTHAGAYTNTQPITIIGQGPGTGVDTPRGFGALRLNNGWAGPINLSGNATIGGSSGTGTILGNISDGGNAYTLEYFGGTIQVGPTTGANTYGITHITEGLSGASVSGNTIVVALNSNAFSSSPIEMVGQSTLRLNGNALAANLITIPAAGVSNYVPVIQNGSTVAPATLTLGGAGDTWQFDGVFANGSSQPLNLAKAGSGTLTLSANSTLTGIVAVNQGTLALIEADAPAFSDPIHGTGTFSNATQIIVASGATLEVSARPGATLTLNSGQTLKGNGVVNGAVTALAGSVINPGSSVGTLTVSGTATLGGTLLLELNRTNASGNCDHLVASGGITYGGTLVVTNIGPALQTNDTFQLFSSGVSGFSTVTLTTVDGNGKAYTWQNNLGTLGSIKVIGVTDAINPNPPHIQFAVSGGLLNLSWPTNLGWILQTNSVSVAETNAWFPYPNSASLINVAIPIDPARANVFFRMVKP